jgi:DNA-binding response OmpR family regulator
MERIKILLVDDEEDFVSTLAERLELRNLTALVATDGDTALRMIDAENPRLMVLDVMMPGMGGLEVLQRTKKSHPEIQVILLTGRGSAEEGIKGTHLGAFDYLVKPIKIEALIQKINEALQGVKRESE